LVAGRIAGFWALFISFALMLLAVYRSRTTVPKIRPLAGLEAIEEAVGRATEMGKPVLFTPGYGDVAGTNAAPTIAGLDMLGYVGRLAARRDTKMAVTVGHPNTYAVALDVLRSAYMVEGRPDALGDDAVTFGSEIQFAFTAHTLGRIQREKPATCLFLGYFAAEAIIVAEAAVAAGSISIAGATNHFQLPFFVAACDYTLIGEEFLAAGAYVSNDPRRIGSIQGQDWVKAIAVALAVIGVIMQAFGNKSMATWLGK
jgi:hypothetical protein